LPVSWNEDDPRHLQLLAESLAELLTDIVVIARRRLPPTVAMAQSWHRRIFDGVRLPVAYYAGEVRDDDPRFPELIGDEVLVGSHRGVAARSVPAELARFEDSIQQAVRRLDATIDAGRPPADNDELRSVLTLCALTHGEWVRIHPFANGNGRTARLWANWCALRYGLPPFFRLRPRPAGDAYDDAAAESMRGEHRPMIGVFAELLEERFRDPESGEPLTTDIILDHV
jgi:fido (protein-threonine AMPylation protein)